MGTVGEQDCYEYNGHKVEENELKLIIDRFKCWCEEHTDELSYGYLDSLETK